MCPRITKVSVEMNALQPAGNAGYASSIPLEQTTYDGDDDCVAHGVAGKARVSDLISLGVGEAIARIGTEIVRFKAPPPFFDNSAIPLENGRSLAGG